MRPVRISGVAQIRTELAVSAAATARRRAAQLRFMLRVRSLLSVRAAAGAAVVVAAFFGPLALANPAASASPAADAAVAAVPSIPARSWAEDCANNEILVIQHPDSYLRYRLHEVNEKGDQVRDQIETPDGSVARLIERDGRPLTSDEDAEERERLSNLINLPSTFFRHVKNDQANKKLGIDLLKLIPDAMIWSWTLSPMLTAGVPGATSMSCQSVYL